MVTIRAKSIIKLDTGQSSLDYEYTKQASVDSIFKDLLHAVVCNKGTQEANDFIEGCMGRYDADFRGFGK